MASIYPHFTQEEYREEAIRCVKELYSFAAFKICIGLENGIPDPV